MPVPQVAVVTDTISCLPAGLVKEYNIHIMPVSLVIDRKNYPDTSLTNEDFWKLFYQAKEPVTTNAVNPTDFSNLFTQLARETDSIVCILVSKALSATHQAAVTAKDILKEEKPSLKIEVIDSKSAAGAEGFIVLEAAKAARAGKSLPEVVQVIQDTMPRVNFFCTLETLKYLIRSGRAPKVALVGDLLKVKPIISIDKKTGLVENVGRAQGRQKAMAKMVNMVKESIDTSKPLHIMVHYTDSLAAGEELKKIATSELVCKEVFFTPYTPVMASQTGPTIAISYLNEK